MGAHLLKNVTFSLVFEDAQNGGLGLGAGAGAGLTEVAEAARQRLQHPAAAAVGSRQCGRSQ